MALSGIMTTMSLFQKNVPLKQYSNFKIGGPAKYFFEARTAEQLQAALAEARALNERIFILGGGYNLLISDAGYDGVVIKPAIKNVGVDETNVVRVGAGVLVAELLEFCVEHELAGFEWAGGLPSTVGGAVWGNAGAFGGETKDSVVQVTSIRVATGEQVSRTNQECQFGYRTSAFKTSATDEVITEVALQLRRGNRAEIQAVIDARKQYRRDKQPLELPNIGSIFKNTPVTRVPAEVLKQFEQKIKQDPFPVLPTAVLNSAAGLKEYRVGDAMLSAKHANFIVNVGQATAADVKAVMTHIKTTIQEKFGVELEQEVIFVE